ncbi:cuticle protein CP14.6-like [Cylas formicarius]|uniref:cuticle protein CP14.6-like n=1 Tax=Cylas formicarius TaxID=197179 RepID=UPI00295886E4|nr:cuticle protein CP14.6-like [Cylas formicarius]
MRARCYLVIVTIFCVQVCVLHPQRGSKIALATDRRTPNSYYFSYYTDYGNFREEEGIITPVGSQQVLRVRGKYYYTGDNGKKYETIYTADENGFRAKTKISQLTLAADSTLLASLAGGGLG